MINVERIMNILQSPKSEWPLIDAEPGTIGGIIRKHLIWMVLIAVVANFIKFSVIGIGGFGMHMRTGVGAGIAQALLSLVLTLLGVYVVSLIVNWLAPKFGGTANPLAAFKLVAYGATAALLGSVLGLIPWLGFLLALAAGLYSIYLVYVGLPILMKSPQDKSLLYTLVVIVCAFLANMLIAGVAAWFLPSPGSHDSAISIRTPQGEMTVQTDKLEAMGRRFEEMGKRIEQASKSGDPGATAKATQEALGEMATSTGGRTPIDPAQLKALLPETMAGMPRGSFEAESRSVMGLTMSSAKASYKDGERSLKLEITDSGSAAGLLGGLAGWASVMVDRETDTGTEKTYRDGDRIVSLKADKDGSRAEYKLLLPNGIVLNARARQMPLDELRKLVEGLNVDAVASAK